MDFDLLATNRSNTHTLWESLRNKGWYDLRRITPDYNGNYALRSTLNALRSMVHDIGKVDETRKATLTVHVHLSMLSLLVDNMIWPYSDVGTGASPRSDG
eukprot:s6249_g2.t1